MKLKFTFKEIIAGIIFISTLSGAWVTVQVRLDNIEKRQERRDKEINEKLKVIDERSYDILNWLINNK